MKPLSCLEVRNSNLVCKWVNEQLNVGRAGEVRRHLRACPSCFSSLMRKTAHSLFTYVSDADTAQLSSVREQLSRVLSHSQPAQQNPNEPIPAFSPDEFVILQLLQWDQFQEVHGLELVRKSELRLPRATIYVTLKRMQENGFIESRHEQEDPSDPGISGCLYKATAFGKRVYRAWSNSRIEESIAKEPFNPKPA